MARLGPLEEDAKQAHLSNEIDRLKSVVRNADVLEEITLTAKDKASMLARYVVFIDSLEAEIIELEECPILVCTTYTRPNCNNELAT